MIETTAREEPSELFISKVMSPYGIPAKYENLPKIDAIRGKSIDLANDQAQNIRMESIERSFFPLKSKQVIDFR